MKFAHTFLFIFPALALFASSANASNLCIYLIGQGNLTGPQVETRFLAQLNTMKAKWNRTCKTSYTLFGAGRDSFIYDNNTNRYVKVSGTQIDAPGDVPHLTAAINKLTGMAAPGDTLKLYLGDHGATHGTIINGDAALRPQLLKTLLLPWTNKGGKVNLVADHCYSGQMLESLYDAKAGKTFGCGISTSNDDVSYSSTSIGNPDFLKGSVDDRYESNASGVGASIRNVNNQNTYMRSSDRFLFKYAQAFLPKLCTDCSINVPQTGVISSMLRTFTDTPFELAIHELDREFLQLRAQVPSYVKKGPQLSFGEMSRRNGEISTKFNAFWLASLPRIPEAKVLISRRDSLQAQLTAWIRQNPGKNVSYCPSYFPSIQAAGAVEGLKAKFMSGKKISDIPGLPGTSWASPNELVTAALGKFRDPLFLVTLRKTWLAKQQAYVMKRAALMNIKNKNDLNAQKLYLQLRSCESETSL